MTELRALRTFAAVARRGSFTRAGEDLSVTQQAVSRTIAGLEAELGTPLLRRTPRGVDPTPAGAVLLEEAERLLADVDVALDRVREAGRGRAGLLRVAATPAIADGELAAMVAAMRCDAPDVAVSIDRIRPRRVTPELVRDEVDVVVGRSLAPAPEIETRELGATPAALAVPAGHRLAARGVASLAELDGERLVVWNRTSAYTGMLIGLAEAAGARAEPVEARVVGGGSLLDVAEGAGVAIVPLPVAASPGVAVLALDPPARLPVVAAWRRWKARPVVERFLAAAGTQRADGQSRSPRP
jgi:DNA-binding transcriptional LysR family regulator